MLTSLFFYFQGKTDNKGIHEIKITYHGIEKEPRPTMVRALAAITDLNNQTSGGRAASGGGSNVTTKKNVTGSDYDGQVSTQ